LLKQRFLVAPEAALAADATSNGEELLQLLSSSADGVAAGASGPSLLESLNVYWAAGDAVLGATAAVRSAMHIQGERKLNLVMGEGVVIHMLAQLCVCVCVCVCVCSVRVCMNI
jgi:hypothetical protein